MDFILVVVYELASWRLGRLLGQQTEGVVSKGSEI